MHQQNLEEEQRAAKKAKGSLSGSSTGDEGKPFSFGCNRDEIFKLSKQKTGKDINNMMKSYSLSSSFHSAN